MCLILMGKPKRETLRRRGKRVSTKRTPVYVSANTTDEDEDETWNASMAPEIAREPTWHARRSVPATTEPAYQHNYAHWASPQDAGEAYTYPVFQPYQTYPPYSDNRPTWGRKDDEALESVLSSQKEMHSMLNKVDSRLAKLEEGVAARESDATKAQVKLEVERQQREEDKEQRRRAAEVKALYEVEEQMRQERRLVEAERRGYQRARRQSRAQQGRRPVQAEEEWPQQQDWQDDSAAGGRRPGCRRHSHHQHHPRHHFPSPPMQGNSYSQQCPHCAEGACQCARESDECGPWTRNRPFGASQRYPGIGCYQHPDMMMMPIFCPFRLCSETCRGH